MRKFLPFLPLVLSLAARTHAEPLPSFEASLTGLRLQANATRIEQLQAKREQLSERMRVTAVKVQALNSRIYGLPNDIFDIRRRSGNPHDPRLRPDVDDLANTVRFTREQVTAFLATVQELRRLAGKDLDLHQPAMDLARVCHNLDNKVKLIEDELAKTAWPLRRAGFDAQVEAIMSNGKLLSDSSAMLAAQAAQLYQQIVSRR